MDNPLYQRLKKVLSKFLSSVTKIELKTALLDMIARLGMTPDEVQSTLKIPLLVITSSRTSRPSLVFYLLQLFEIVINLKPSI